jgi:poly(ADP-ribose) glycohydrolase
MEVNEAIIISGTERFSEYKGYAMSMQFEDDYNDPTPFDSSKRRLRNHVIGIDATVGAFGQFKSATILRDIIKCYAGLVRHRDLESEENGVKNIYVTGHWGCGAFGGNKELKAIQQIIGASLAGVDLMYTSFKEAVFEERLSKFYDELISLNTKIGPLYRALISYEVEGDSTRDIFGFVISRLKPPPPPPAAAALPSLSSSSTALPSPSPLLTAALPPSSSTTSVQANDSNSTLSTSSSAPASLVQVSDSTTVLTNAPVITMPLESLKPMEEIPKVDQNEKAAAAQEAPVLQSEKGGE